MNRKRKYNENEYQDEGVSDGDKLRHAVRKGDVTAVKRLVKGGVLADNNKKFWFGGTILHDAVAGGKLPIIKLLLQAKADVNARTQDGRTCLHTASRMGSAGNVDIVKELLSHGAEVNVQTKDKRTALHYATWRGNTEIVKQLVHHGAKVNVEDQELWTPLYWAAKSNYLQIAKVLVEKGACLNCVNEMEMSPLYEVIKNGHVDLASYLISEGASVTGKTKGIFQYMVENKDMKTEDRILLCDLFVLAGYPLSTNQHIPEILSRKPYIDQAFVKHVQNRQHEVLTLKCLCRISVRNAIIRVGDGSSISRTLTDLPLPKILQEYLVSLNS